MEPSPIVSSFQLPAAGKQLKLATEAGSSKLEATGLKEHRIP
jgi:hypothetical protein